MKVFKLLFLIGLVSLSSCTKKEGEEQQNGARLAMFIGLDISGSFMKGRYFDDSLKFLAHYIYAHLKGLGGLEVPKSLFVGSIGGAKPNEPKTFFPIQTFENKSIAEIEAELHGIFPKKKENPFTDFNAYIRQVTEFCRSRSLVLRPISIVMLSDGIPDVSERENDYKRIELKPLENLSRNVTIRLLYTNADVGMNWQTKVKRKRVKIWTQDAKVMVSWNDPHILLPNESFSNQTLFFNWVLDNVDFGVRSKIVN